MRPHALARTVISLTAAVGLTTGTLAVTGAAFAAAPSPAIPASAVKPVSTLAVNNLGLTSREAKKIQPLLKERWGYTGDIDGQLGTDSWKAIQRFLRGSWGYNDDIDGIVGANTIKALQRWLKDRWNYDGAIDGVAGPGTKAAFKRAANSCPDC